MELELRAANMYRNYNRTLDWQGMVKSKNTFTARRAKCMTNLNNIKTKDEISEKN